MEPGTNMKKPLLSNALWMICALAFCGALSSITLAAVKKDARVTQVIRNVHLLTGKSAAKPASVNDLVAEGQAVRTGGESRAELTFTDRSITRLGANTVFTYGEGARVLDLTSGAALIVVPKETGTITVNTAATTAAVTGFVALVESHVTAATKWMIVAGHACVKRRGKGHGDPAAHATGAEAGNDRTRRGQLQGAADGAMERPDVHQGGHRQAAREPDHRGRG